MEILRLLFLAFTSFIFFSLLMGYGSFRLRLGKKEKPILDLRIGDCEDNEKEEKY